jgi:hypothetical protein
MHRLIDSIVDKDFVTADYIIEETVELIMSKKLEEAKKMCAAKMVEQKGHVMNRTSSKLRSMDVVEDSVDEAIDPTEIHDGPAPTGQRVNQAGKGDKESPNTTVVPKNNLKEEEQIDEARIQIVKARIRGGKIQRRKKISNVPGMTIRGGKLQRMSPAERRRRKMGQRRGKIKRKAKMNRAIMKRQRSIRKRKALGL